MEKDFVDEIKWMLQETPELNKFSKYFCCKNIVRLYVCWVGARHLAKWYILTEVATLQRRSITDFFDIYITKRFN